MKFLKNLYNDFIKYPIYLMSHPIKGFDEFKRDNLGKVGVAVVFVLLSCLYSVLSYNGFGFHMNNNNPDKFNALTQFLIIFVPVILFTIGNWTITVLFDGKGTIIDIFKLIGYSLFPFMVLSFVGLALSNILALDEMAIFTVVSSLASLLLIYNLFFGLMGIHEYSVIKNIFTIILSIVSVAIMLFCCLLVLTVSERVIDTVLSIYNEIIQRFF